MNGMATVFRRANRTAAEVHDHRETGGSLPVLLTVDEAATCCAPHGARSTRWSNVASCPASSAFADACSSARTTCYTGWTRSARHRRRSKRR